MADAGARLIGGGINAARPLRMLYSYHFFKDTNFDALFAEHFAGIPCDLLADSGAFSAYTTGAVITVEEYAAWLWKWQHVFKVAAALDVIGDADASVAQSVRLRELAPPSTTIVPVFHSTDGDWAYLQRYIDLGFDYIGISPIGNLYKAPALLDRWLAECFSRRPAHVRYHGFGVTGSRTLKFPWYTVDSATFSMVFQYAEFPAWDTRTCGFRRIASRAPGELLSDSATLRAHGVRVSDLVVLRSRDARYTEEVEARLLAGVVRAYRAAENWLEAHGGARALFLATSVGQTAPQHIARAVRTGGLL